MAVVISGASGSFTNGGSITITGSGFGSKATEKPYFWCDFSGGNINPSSLGVHTTWDLLQSIVYSATGGWQNGPCAQLDPAILGISANDSGATPKGDIHITEGWKFDTYGQKSFISRRMKRQNGSYGASGSKDMEWMQWFEQYTGKANMVWNKEMQLQTQNVSPDSYNYITNPDYSDTFFNEEWEFQCGASSGALATFNFLVNSKIYDQNNASDNIVCFRSSGSAIFDQVDPMFEGNYSASGTYNSFKRWWSQIYIDNTWQRVYLGARSTWATNAEWTRELIIPSAWSAGGTSITGKVINPGTFAQGTSAYLYVVDANGAVNANGFQVTIGAGGGDSPPTGTPVLSVR